MSIRELPDFLKSGDPALTFPHGKTYGVNHPKGVPNLPGPITPDELARDWLAHVAAGRIGVKVDLRGKPGPEDEGIGRR